MKIGAVRGSHKRRGAHAVMELVESVKNGADVFITPDGPRGPRYRMSPGPIYAASKLGVPIVPLAINYSSCWKLNSWDRFQIPKPFSKVSVHLGKKIFVPPDLSSEELEKYRVLVEERLNEVSLVSK